MAEGQDHAVTNSECNGRMARLEAGIKEDIGSLKELLLAHIQAVRDLTTQSFESAKEAKQAADAALKEYKSQSNEIRGAMTDLTRTMIPRTESSSHWESTNQRMDGIKQQLEEKISITSRQISDLAGIVSGMAGGDIGKEKTIKLANWGIGIAVAIGLGLIGIVAQIFMLIWKK